MVWSLYPLLRMCVRDSWLQQSVCVSYLLSIGYTSYIMGIFLHAVPAEHPVVSKEQAGGYYHLSAYYMAKFISEIPLVLIDPSIFFVITFWVAGIGGPVSFFGMWAILLLNCLAGQVCMWLYFHSFLQTWHIISWPSDWLWMHCQSDWCDTLPISL